MRILGSVRGGDSVAADCNSFPLFSVLLGTFSSLGSAQFRVTVALICMVYRSMNFLLPIFVQIPSPSQFQTFNMKIEVGQ